jgi:hypothetical protein
MRIATSDARQDLAAALEKRAIDRYASVAERSIWLHAIGYPGLTILEEALADTITTLPLVKDALGLNLHGVSCVYLFDQIADYIMKNGRIYLRNVRHGLFLLPDSVENNYGIGCPVDPAFALGGPRAKDPYAEKIAIAAAEGIEIDTDLWARLTA